MTIFYTVATLNYLPYAVTLLDSVKTFHPEFDCKIGLVDYFEKDEIKTFPLLTKYPVISLHELNSPDFDFITGTYSPAELANCCKILFAEYFLSEETTNEVIFADSDILLFDKLPETSKDYDIVITPHFTSAPPLEHVSLELEVINAGMYNAGFFKIKRTANSIGFIRWLKDRCIPECVDNRCKGLYFDQTWYNFLPLYFDNVYIERDYGCNVAYWNLHERKITVSGNKFYVNDIKPLRFFHYSGWSVLSPLEISQFQHRYTVGSRPDVLPLLQLYYDKLKNNNFDVYSKIECRYTPNKDLHTPKKKESKNKISLLIKKLTKTIIQ